MQTLKESIRSKILERARSEFSARGYANASMKCIAAGCGISVGTIYKYFGSKDRLYNAVVDGARAALGDLFGSRDADTFYSIVNEHRTGLRILLFRGRDDNAAVMLKASGCSMVGSRMCALWLCRVLEHVLMHKPTKAEAILIIDEFISVRNHISK
ncbi:MAG: TetR/AcrR family transcriptional regulator [Bacteroides sp.]|nr:TetR/AcrR family transcriptional regulator [Bacteroides sp.]MCM1457952.1 TetR/AcrR family transcriptional regulator [Lachnoclostridium sp.]